jgi:hypothetical protein
MAQFTMEDSPLCKETRMNYKHKMGGGGGGGL